MTSSRLGLSFALASAFGVAVAATPSRADACSPPCDAPPFSSEGQILPAGVSSLPIGATGTVTITDADAKVVFTGTPKDGVVALGAPLAEGSYLLRHTDESCRKGDRPFGVGPAKPDATTLGALAISEPVQVEARKFEGVGSCQDGDTPKHVSVGLSLSPSADLEPWLPLTHLEVAVDGVLQRGLANTYGPRGSTAQPRSAGTPVYLGALTALCQAPTSNDTAYAATVALGMHHVEVRGQVLGTTTPLTVASADVALACTGLPGESGTSTSSSSSSSGGATTEEQPPSSSSSSSEASGCSATPARTPFSPSAMVGALGVAAALVAGLRRRRR